MRTVCRESNSIKSNETYCKDEKKFDAFSNACVNAAEGNSSLRVDHDPLIFYMIDLLFLDLIAYRYNILIYISTFNISIRIHSSCKVFANRSYFAQ